MVLSKENAVNNTRKTSCILVTDGYDKKLNPNNHFSSTHQKKFDFSLHESCLKKLGKNCPFSFILVRKNRLKNLAMEIYYNAKNCRVSIEIEFLNSNQYYVFDLFVPVTRKFHKTVYQKIEDSTKIKSNFKIQFFLKLFPLGGTKL